MKKHPNLCRAFLFFIGVFLAALPTQAKVYDFENESDNAHWHFINDAQTNKWIIGTAAGSQGGGTNALYISNDGTSYSYTNFQHSTVWAYCDEVLSEMFTISFNWKGVGWEEYDYMSAYLIPVSATQPTAGSTTLPTGAIKIGGWFCAHSAWTTFIEKEHPLTESYRLYFMWHNNFFFENGAPIAIDNVSIQLICSDSHFQYENLSDTALSVIKYTGTDSEVVIPASYRGLPIVAINEKAFADNNFITSVTIPKSITRIGESAFAGCTGLTSVAIPDAVTSIGAYAFYGCTGITAVTIPNSVTSIGNQAFYGCTGLTSITIPENVTNIGSGTFGSCSSLTSVIWNAKNYTNLSQSKYAPFYDIRSQIISFTFGDNVEHIPAYLCYGMSKLSVTIPDGVMSIGASAFNGCTERISVMIPNSVESIGDNAFSQVLNVVYSGVATGSPWGAQYINKYVEDYLIYESDTKTQLLRCAETVIGEFIIPNSVTTIEDEAFQCCTGLTSVTIPESVTSIGNNAFFGCKNLVSVIWNAKICSDFVYDSSNSKSTSPFYDIASQITSFTFGDEVGHIPAYLCCGMSKQSSVTIPESVTSIGGGAFSGCSGLTSVIWKAKDYTAPINYQSETPFYDIRSQITSFTFGEEVERIPCLCWGMSELTAITIPGSVISIGPSAFRDCSGLVKINYTGDIAGWCSIDFGTNTANPVYYSYNLYINDVEVKDLVIPDGVTAIKNYAFLHMGLTSVTIGNSVTSIGKCAFDGCSGLTSITIPDGVTSIGSSAFYGCSGLASVTIGNGVWSIGDYAFTGCSGITSVVWNAEACDNFLYSSYEKFFPPFYDARSSITSFTFGDAVRYIPSNLCREMSKLTSITIPENVTRIGGHAFYGCSGLTSVTIPDGVWSIEVNAFADCYGLTSVIWNAKNCDDFQFSTYSYPPFYDARSSITSFTFGDAVEHIPAYLCWGMSKLISVTIPNSVTSIGGSAFSGCTGLTSIIWNAKKCNGSWSSYKEAPFYNIASQITSFTFGDEVKIIPDYLCDNMSSLTSITIPESVTSIGAGVFFGCRNLAAMTIPNSVTSIGKMAFDNCYSLASVTLSENMTGIEYSTFYNCSSLTSIIIPNSITSIGNEAFHGCTGLTSITCGTITPPACGDGVFTGVSSGTVVHIPCGATEAYQNANGWNGLKQQEPPMPDYTITVRPIDTGMGQVELQSRKQNFDCEAVVSFFATPNLGYHFVQWNDGNTDNPRTVTLTQDTAFVAEFALDYSGKCGDNLYWEYKDGELRITGSGAMFNYTATTMPWLLLRDSIYSVALSNSASSIGANAFSGCSALTSFTWNPDEEQEITHVSLSLDPNAVYFVDTKNWSDTHDIYVYAWTESPFVEDSGWPGVRADKATFTYNGYDVYYFTDYSGVYENCIFNNGNSGTENKTEDLTWTGGKAYFDGGWHRLYQGENITRTHIGDYAFSGCTALTSVTIPEKVKDMGVNPFDGCTSLTSVTWNAKNGSDYRESSSPFYSIASQITSFTFGNKVEYIPAYLCYGMTGLTSVAIPNSVMSIGEGAFSNCSKLSELRLGAGLETVGANAFAGCLRLGNIHCYAALPPLAEESSFANYNARLYVPCEVLGDYQLAIVFGNFKYIDCISSDGVDVPTNTVTVTPSTNDATFTWPSNNNANAYTLVITKDGVVFCTLTFNANGQLMGIAFAPSKDRNNAHAPQAAQATTNGWQFTVTGLNEGSNYAYTMTVTDNGNKVLQTYEGTFTTLGGDLPEGLTQTSEVATGIQKIIRDGQVLILRNGKTYTLTGLEVR